MGGFRLGMVSAATIGVVAMTGASGEDSGAAVSVSTGTVAEKISQIGERLSTEFTGLEVRGDAIAIYSTGNSDNLHATVAGLETGNVSISWVTVPNSLDVLTKLTTRLQQDSAALASSGIFLVEWGPDIKTGKVEIGLREYSTSAEMTLLERYGADFVEVDHTNVPVPEEYDRFHDAVPWWGGDQLSAAADGLADCTSGAPVIGSLGNYNVVTDAHCFGAGTAIYNGTLLVGHAGARLYSQGGNVDAELIRVADSGADGVLWNNRPGGPLSHVRVAGYYHDQEFAGNANLHVSGAVTKEQSLVSSSVGKCITFRSGHQTCDVVVAASDEGPSDPTAKGDSGGAVYTYGENDASYVIIHGYLLGGNGTNVFFATERNLINAYGATLIHG